MDCRTVERRTSDHSAADELQATAALAAAQDLAAVVREQDLDLTAAWLATRDRAQLEAVTVALAAMLPLDQKPADLLAWLPADPLDATRPATRTLPGIPEDVRRAHAAFTRAKTAGVEPAASIVEGERRYQSLRYRLRLKKRHGVAA